MRIRAAGALLIPLALLAAACAGTSSAGTSSADDSSAGAGLGGGSRTVGSGSTTLDVGDQKGGSQAVLEAAGELKNLPYKIGWSTFTSGPPLLEAVNAKAVDIGGVGNTPPVFAAASNSAITVVASSRQSEAGDAIVVPQGSTLTSVADLKGKSIAVAQGSSSNYTLVAALAKAGLKPSDVTFDYLQPADALAAFSRHAVDAWATWDPYTTQVEQADHARILATGQGLPGVGLNFQVASPSALADKAKAAAIADYLKRLHKAQLWADAHPEQWARVWAKDTGLSYGVALAAVKQSEATTVPVAVDSSAIASEQQIADAFAALKLIPHGIAFADFVDKRFNAGLPPSTTAPRTS
ncbi:ABC transporter substrate-binding protein [Streptomyces sp. RB6PN25]|uniref:ABC transporter substrate-binding protein n=1 Tax=Streptomyces humicola TaxID=2953240 RepID=A0ABT1Q1Z3_9ACTN|nr:ABC transporter substrate-binding protein [Streptomyces humicola]MCQ4083320.1 ABC transporter substrate-binding protein [Streptomyces humicola]